MDKQYVNLPENICGNMKIACGQRKQGKTCRCPECGYCIHTPGIREKIERVMLLNYVTGGNHG
jgi:hypothetical protein